MVTSKSGFCFPYEVKQTQGKGLGVFSLTAIKEGSIVWRHIPRQFIVYNEPSFHRAIEKLSRTEIVHELTHVFGLEDFTGCVIKVLDDGTLINHAPNSNLTTNRTKPVIGETDAASPHYLQDVERILLEDRFALIATHDIKAGEEFTHNYWDEVDPPYLDALSEKYGVDEAYLYDR